MSREQSIAGARSKADLRGSRSGTGGAVFVRVSTLAATVRHLLHSPPLRGRSIAPTPISTAVCVTVPVLVVPRALLALVLVGICAVAVVPSRAIAIAAVAVRALTARTRALLVAASDDATQTIGQTMQRYSQMRSHARREGAHNTDTDADSTAQRSAASIDRTA